MAQCLADKTLFTYMHIVGMRFCAKLDVCCHRLLCSKNTNVFSLSHRNNKCTIYHMCMCVCMYETQILHRRLVCYFWRAYMCRALRAVFAVIITYCTHTLTLPFCWGGQTLQKVSQIVFYSAQFAARKCRTIVNIIESSSISAGLAAAAHKDWLLRSVR